VTEPDEDWFDPDIAAMKLGYGEKAGLQIYRNYTRSFEEHAIKKFVEQCACPDAVWKMNISGGVEFQSRINSWMCAGSTSDFGQCGRRKWRASICGPDWQYDHAPGFQEWRRFCLSSTRDASVSWLGLVTALRASNLSVRQIAQISFSG
jgi:hypothetical protein